MRKLIYKVPLLVMTFLLVVNLKGQSVKHEIFISNNNLKKTIDGTWVKDSLKSKDYQREITVKTIEFSSSKTLMPDFVNILSSYLQNYGYSRTWMNTFEIVNAGTGNILFNLTKFRHKDYLRTFRYCLFKQEEKYYLLLLTDLEDRNEETSLLFDVDNFEKKTKSIIVENKEFGKYNINKNAH